MTTVQETNRYQRAIAALSKRGVVTTAGIIAWLKENEGVGCSMREAHAELKAWRSFQVQSTDLAADFAAGALLASTAGLTRDARSRVIHSVRVTLNWERVAGATNEAASRALELLRQRVAVGGDL